MGITINPILGLGGSGGSAPDGTAIVKNSFLNYDVNFPVPSGLSETLNLPDDAELFVNLGYAYTMQTLRDLNILAFDYFLNPLVFQVITNSGLNLVTLNQITPPPQGEVQIFNSNSDFIGNVFVDSNAIEPYILPDTAEIVLNSVSTGEFLKTLRNLTIVTLDDVGNPMPMTLNFNPSTNEIILQEI